MIVEGDHHPLTAFRFRVQFLIGGLTYEAGFSDVSGLGQQVQVKKFNEGGYNRGQRVRPGPGSVGELTFKRGMILDATLWQWVRSFVEGSAAVEPADGSITLMESSGTRPKVRWGFECAVPTAVRGPQLNAQSFAVAMEELVIAPEALNLEIEDRTSGTANAP